MRTVSVVEEEEAEDYCTEWTEQLSSLDPSPYTGAAEGLLWTAGLGLSEEHMELLRFTRLWFAQTNGNM